jgi:WD40 repeat protein
MLTGSRSWPNSIAVAPNSELLATTSVSNGQIRLWNITTGANIAFIKGHNTLIPSEESSGDTNSVAPIVGNGSARVISVWDPTHNTYTGYATDYSVVCAITFSHDSQLLASASAVDGVIKVWDVGSNACIATLAGHSSWVSQLVFLPQSDVLASSSGDRTVKIWDIRTAVCTATFEGQSRPDNQSIVFSHDYNLLALGRDSGDIVIWDISTGKCQIKLPGTIQEPPHTIAFSHNSALIASIAPRPREGEHKYRWHQALEFWNVSTGQCLATVDINYFALNRISFNTAGSCLSTSVGDFMLKGTYYPGLTCRRC